MHTHPSIHRPTVLAAVALLALLGCGGGSNPGPGGGTTVTGQVLDGFAQPLPGRTVLVGSQSTTSDANGKFTVSGVTTPYDVVVIEPGSGKVATVYAQLTRTDPKLRDLGATSTPTRQATLGGNLAGGDALPTPDATLTGVSWGSPESSTGSYVTSSPYAFTVAWSGPTSITGSVHALQWTVDPSGTVTGYRSHAVTTGVSLSAGNVVSNANLLLAAPLTTNVSGSTNVPGGYTIVDRTVYLTFDDGAFFPVSSDGISNPSFDLPVPSGIGASAQINVTAGDGGTQTSAQLSGVAPGTTGLALTLPAPALATTPADGATGVDTGTDLVWSPVPNAVHLLILSGGSSDPTYIVVSGGTRARIPDLTAQGLGLPSGRLYDWGLVAVGPSPGIDAFTATGVFPREGFGFQTVSSTQFTTR